jgi:hypothetical protein
MWWVVITGLARGFIGRSMGDDDAADIGSVLGARMVEHLCKVGRWP